MARAKKTTVVEEAQENTAEAIENEAVAETPTETPTEEAEAESEAVSEAPTVITSDSAATTVTVAYNSPQGLRLKTSNGKVVHLAGSPVMNILDQDGKPCRGRFGMTVIPIDVWEDLQKKYGNCSFWKKKIFAHTKTIDTHAEATEKADVKHGKEQISPKKVKVSDVDKKEDAE